MAARSPQPLTLEIMEKYCTLLKSWRIEQAALQRDLLDL
jgi:hypothetical protein